MSLLSPFMKWTRDRISTIFIIVILLAGCDQFMIMSQDCGDYASAIQGTVTNFLTQEPIAGAEVVVRSQGVGNCPNSRPIDEVRTTTDDQGRFYHEVFIYADDRLEIEVTAPGCSPFSRNDVSYTDFVGTVGDIQGMWIQLGCGNPALTSTASP